MLIVFLKVAYIEISDDLGATAITISYEDVGRNRKFGAEVTYRNIWRNRGGGPQFPRRGNLILDTVCPQLNSEQAWYNGRHGAES